MSRTSGSRRIRKKNEDTKKRFSATKKKTRTMETEEPTDPRGQQKLSELLLCCLNERKGARKRKRSGRGKTASSRKEREAKTNL